MVGLGCTESYPLLSQKRKDSPRFVCLSTLPSYVPTYPPLCLLPPTLELARVPPRQSLLFSGFRFVVSSFLLSCCRFSFSFCVLLRWPAAHALCLKKQVHCESLLLSLLLSTSLNPITQPFVASAVVWNKKNTRKPTPHPSAFRRTSLACAWGD
jgi:hypothetical protein